MIKQAYLYLFILMGVWLTGCQDIDDFPTNPLESDGKTVEVTLSTKVPGITVQSRAGEVTDDEKKLEYVGVLVFKVEGSEESKTEKFAYYTESTIETLSNDNVGIKTKLKIGEDGQKYSLVLLANLKEELEDFFNDENSYQDEDKEELLKQIIFEQEGKWPNGNNETEFRALPMWGESP
ncbi:MAG: hypothetical protein LUE93_11650, partial [Bacteroides sp.]|nr:hypothetical protein [Bacteroides sp.]